MRRTFPVFVSLLLLLLVWHHGGAANRVQATEMQSTVCSTQPKLTTLAHDVLPAVALPGFKQTELLNVPGGVYVTWSKSETTVHPTIWRYSTAARASVRDDALYQAEDLVDTGDVSRVPGSYYGDTTGGTGTAESETLFTTGIYVVRVHTDQSLSDGGQLAREVTQCVYSRLTLITRQ
jgi:hypothetical protein